MCIEFTGKAQNIGNADTALLNRNHLGKEIFSNKKIQFYS